MPSSQEPFVHEFERFERDLSTRRAEHRALPQVREHVLQRPAGDLVVVLEAMKMEQPLTAHRSGIVKNLSAQVGATVTSGSALCEIVD